MKTKRKIRFYYYEDPDVAEYLRKNIPRSYISEWIRGATKTKMKKLSTTKH